MQELLHCYRPERLPGHPFLGRQDSVSSQQLRRNLRQNNRTSMYDRVYSSDYLYIAMTSWTAYPTSYWRCIADTRLFND